MIEAAKSTANAGAATYDIPIARGEEFLTVKSVEEYTITFPGSAVTVEMAAGAEFGCNVSGMQGQTITLTKVGGGNLGKINVLIEKQCGSAGV
jgi:hypothetical protein